MFEEAKEKYGADAPELSVARLVEEKMGVLLRPSEPPEPEKPASAESSTRPSRSELMAEAHKHMPQGVAENYRYWGCLLYTSDAADE